MINIDFLYFDAGGGHRASATALKLVCEQQQRPWTVRLVNLQEVLDSIDVFRKWTGRRMQDWYNLLLRSGWTLGSAELLPLMHWIIRRFGEQVVREMALHWNRTQPAMVVSLIPNFNRYLRQALSRACPAAPFVVLLTDFADYPPNFWMEPQDEYVLCGSERAVEQAREMGHGEDHIFRTPGMILHPRFYEPFTANRADERRKLGLDPEKPTGLVLFGGQGAWVMKSIAERLERSGLDLQLILICGRNERLAAELRRRAWRIPVFVEGFTHEVPYYMFLSDFFIGKPGPGSVAEALQMKLPVIVERNAWTLPQERYNTEFVREKQVGLVVRSFRSRELVEAVAELLKPGVLVQYRRNAAALENDAVFMIPDILSEILARHASRAAAG
ncbi:MAG: galactosyldiacylglycerol synthase [Firmicutes bacterium]|nr:galactosyldiacylglycerol synthase [Bacillota bacterium]